MGVRIRNILTIDVEDYFSASLGTYQRRHLKPIAGRSEKERLFHETNGVLSVLRKYGVRATFFVVGEIAREYPELVATICRDGHDIGSHSYEHRLVRNMTEDEFSQDLEKSIQAIEAAASFLAKIFGQTFVGFVSSLWRRFSRLCRTAGIVSSLHTR